MSTATSSVDVEGRRRPSDAISLGGRGHRPGGGHRRRGLRRTEESRRSCVRHTFRRRQQAHSAADADRQPDRGSSRHPAGPAAAVRHAPRYGTALCRREAEARRRPDCFRRHHRAWRRQSHRLRGARDAWPRRSRSTNCRTRRSRCSSPCARKAGCTVPAS